MAGCFGDAPSDAPQDDDQPAFDDFGLQATPTTGVVRGFVVDEAIRPLANVRVEVVNQGRRTTTNDQGAFGFDALQPGSHQLDFAHDGFEAARQSVHVEAGVSDPAPVRVLLRAAGSLQPFIQEHHVELFVFGSYLRQSSYGSIGNPLDDSESIDFTLPVDTGATVAQAEFVWRPTNPYGENLFVSGSTRNVEDQRVNGSGVTGPSPLLHRARTTGENGTATSAYYFFRPGDSGALPIPFGLLLNQHIDAFVHVFYNLEPREDWRFSRDGPYPL